MGPVALCLGRLLSSIHVQCWALCVPSWPRRGDTAQGMRLCSILGERAAPSRVSEDEQVWVGRVSEVVGLSGHR